MTSRLDRLFILLESGSSGVTRRAAAKQIGEVQKLHPHELHYLLNRLIKYLHNSSWDTRIAASQAIEAILSNVPTWIPLSQNKELNNEYDESLNIKTEFLRFKDFNFDHVLQKGARLMGSEGTEFDLHESPNSSDRIKQQRALLNERLGLSQASKLGLNFVDMINDDDMKNDFKNSSKINDQKVPVQDILKIKNIPNLPVVSNEPSLSCREINRAKRKARQTGTGSGSGASRSNSTIDEPEKKKQKVETEKFEVFYDCNQPTPDGTGSWGDTTNWPFNQFYLRLCLDLFNSKWEIRHGSATALRELINCHSTGGGTTVHMTEEEIEFNHSAWLEDMALRLLCVLSLDRFGDFVSDQVVAPVRETCAQVLGIVLKEMPTEKVNDVVQVLLKLLKQSEWEVRHGGLLGLKYIFVVRDDLLQKFLPLTIADILIGLFDPVDDVGAVAASTLIPVSIWLPKLLNETQVASIVKMLWDLLLDQDELTSACSSFMGLLAAILCLPNAAQWIQMEPMCVLIPRLWPFLSHSSSSVRRSTLQTLKTLTEKTSLKTIACDELNNSITINSSKKIDFDSKNFKLNFGVIDWNSTLLQEAMRHVFQRVLVEPIFEIQELGKQVWLNLIKNADLSALLHAACPFVSSWICLAMQPPRLAFDQAILIHAKSKPNSEKRKLRMEDDLGGSLGLQQKLYLGGNESTPQDVREKNFIKARINASEMLGSLSSYLVLPAPGVVYTPIIESPIDCYTKVLMGHLQSRSAVQRLVCGLLISFWSLSDTSIHPGPLILQEKLKSCVEEYVYFDEVAGAFTRLLQEGHDFVATLKQNKIPMKEFENTKILSLEQIQLLTTTATEDLKSKHNLKPKISEILEDRRRELQSLFTQTNQEQYFLNISTQAALAGAIVCLQCLPEKLNPVIKPLMESIKREPCELLQQLTAQFLVQLLDQVEERNPCPNSKIFNNLCALLKSDQDFTPKINFSQKPMKEYNLNDKSPNAYYGILTLANQQKNNGSINGTLPSTSRGPGRPPLTPDIEDSLTTEDPASKQNRIQRIGATYAITNICKHFGSNLDKKLPVLFKIMIYDIEKILDELPTMELMANEVINEEKANDLVTSLQLAEIAVPHIDKSLQDIVFKLLPLFALLLTHPLKVIRHMVARAIATMAKVDDCVVMKFVIETVIPLLEKTEKVICRQGAAETIERIVETLQFKMVPYVVLLVVPLLGRMSDSDEFVRLMSTHCFATLIQLMPLDSKSNTVAIASKELQARKTRDREFLDYLFAPKTIPDFKVPVSISAELRSYQQAGINWLWFLNKYNLHGILCDDMGLGKTLQTICVLAGDHYQRKINKQSSLPSIVICPPTLTGHWVYEVEKFLPTKFLRPLHYVGLPIGREKLRSKVGNCNLVVVSYDTVRKDVEFFNSVHWNYCVLDEGHIIKNGKTKSSKAIKQLKANHRLILSGTPIQNNVLELWSLFDFLMPGFLGTEKQFSQKFSRPILASRDPKSSSKEQEAGVLAMEALHRQILPFLLRRVKEDVLTDLPPKITQDLLCELSPLQERLYEDFSKTHLNSEIKDCIENLGETENLTKKTHIFQALRYLQNVCNHPKLVLSQNHPEYSKITQELSQKNSSLSDIDHSAKLPALKQLLLDCGIGVDTEIVNQHRALIFCQLKAMLDIVENDLLKKHLPAVSFLRLDGSIPASSRHEIVTKFNEDPSIDVLLLTTQVGGLGLNLTGADTVIFVEHDWNPMKDLQAMDRAHRIGQRKVVNVYRLITRKSLEEKIMGLQKFKILTANTVVSAENASMETMGTDQLLDLFNLADEEKVRKQSAANSSNTKTSIKNVIETLPELWDDKQYEEEYDLTSFVQGLKK